MNIIVLLGITFTNYCMWFLCLATFPKQSVIYNAYMLVISYNINKVNPNFVEDVVWKFFKVVQAIFVIFVFYLFPIAE